MADEEGYRRLAKNCREQATLLLGEAAARWLRIAEQYEKLADGLRTLRLRRPRPKPEDEK